MFVIADIEWMTNSEGYHYPTQLAAVKVDENWNEVSTISSYIKPRYGHSYNLNHIAYTGAYNADLTRAKSAYKAFCHFDNWICEDDVIVWWHYESETVFNQLYKSLLEKPNTHKSVKANKYVHGYLFGKAKTSYSLYRLAKINGIDADIKLSHCSENDIKVFRNLMAEIKYPQEQLLQPLVTEEKPSDSSAPKWNLTYVYVGKTNTVHKRGCSSITDEFEITKQFPKLDESVRRRYKPCDCCKKEYTAFLRAKNKDIVERAGFNYLYSPDSKIFHKHTCPIVFNSRRINGTLTYGNPAIQSRTPCKFCNPTPNDELRRKPKQKEAVQPEKINTKSISKKKVEAIERQRAAVAQRRRLLEGAKLSEQEVADVFTLTQTRFAFFVAKGYNTFHTGSCSKLHGLSQLKGFVRYSEAVGAGFAPCRKCKPTAKMDVEVYVPITSDFHDNERIEDLEEWCEKEGYAHHAENDRLHIETPVGKWIVETKKSPVGLQHINLVNPPYNTDYHIQPVLFLSNKDALDYIKRHDENLMRKKERGILYVRFFADGNYSIAEDEDTCCESNTEETLSVEFG